MQHTEDQGAAFGRWPNKTARLMYHDIMPLALNGVDTTGRVADYGGANGLLKEWVPQAVTVDYDVTKGPDICADIRTYVGEYDLIVLRYVLHYMPDEDVRALLKHMASYHKGRLLCIQFANQNLVAKNANSVGETKWFRTPAHTARLVEEHWQPVSRKTVEYEVDAEFYRWRLNHPNPTGHNETLIITELEART